MEDGLKGRLQLSGEKERERVEIFSFPRDFSRKWCPKTNFHLCRHGTDQISIPACAKVAEF